MTGSEILQAIENTGAEILYRYETEELILRGGNRLDAATRAAIREAIRPGAPARGELLQWLIPPETAGYSAIDWSIRIGRIEEARRKEAETPAKPAASASTAAGEAQARLAI